MPSRLPLPQATLPLLKMFFMIMIAWDLKFLSLSLKALLLTLFLSISTPSRIKTFSLKNLMKRVPTTLICRVSRIVSVVITAAYMLKSTSQLKLRRKSVMKASNSPSLPFCWTSVIVSWFWNLNHHHWWSPSLIWSKGWWPRTTSSGHAA